MRQIILDERSRRGHDMIYTIVNQKGGVGKTTTAVNLAAYLALAGRPTLLLDLDPQANATSGLGIDKNSFGRRSPGHGRSAYDVLVEDYPVADAAMATTIDHLSLLPSNLDLAGAEVELMPRVARETVLKRALEPIRDAYEFILIDTPPSLGILTLNGLTAADAIIVPIQCEYYALEGVSQLMQTIEIVQDCLNPRLEVALVILTMYDNRVRLSQQVVAEVRSAFGDRVSPTVVPRNVRLSEAPSHGEPIALYDPRSRGAEAYRSLAEEVIRLGQTRSG